LVLLEWRCDGVKNTVFQRKLMAHCSGLTELGQQIVAQALSGTGSTPEQQSKFQECVHDALVGGNTGTPQLATQLLQGFLNPKG
jgi:hypothetical protein